MSRHILSDRRPGRPPVRLLLTLLLFVSMARAATAEDRNVRVEEVHEGSAVTLVATLNHCTEATITLTASLENMDSSVPLPATVDTAGQKKVVLAVLRPHNPNLPWTYRWGSYWKPGRRLFETPRPYAYSLPYRGVSRQVIQAAYGAYSHYAGSQDEEAIDWAMPVGTPIYAARPGIVVGLRADCTIGGPDLKLAGDYNYLVIRHDDGTFAEYLHLERDGIFVRLGDRVNLQQPIAWSGYTGYTNTPHLHFAVFYTLDGASRRTIPVTFKSVNGEAVKLEEGRSY